VPTVVTDGIATRYEVVGSGPPLLMFAPGGFNSTLDNWKALGLYRRLNLLDHLPERYTCIMFDRREAGGSGGRVERVSWDHYVLQAVGLLDHLDVERAHLMGACVGCSAAAAVAVAHPDRVSSMVLYSPAGGPRYRMTSRSRFEDHLAYVRQHGLDGVVELAGSHEEGFSKDPRVGPWVSVIRRDGAFADAYVAVDQARYLALVTGMGRTLFDRDTVPGPEPEDLMQLDTPALIVPGEDTSHAPSAARYLQECLPHAEYWDVPVAEQTEETAPPRVLEFLDAVSGAPVR
jgi:pimeloyl-ACP methyl ester carboxylesterase